MVDGLRRRASGSEGTSVSASRGTSVSSLEVDIMRELERALSRPESPVRVWRQNAGLLRHDGRMVRGAPKGAADLTGIVVGHGWRVEIEIKAGRGRLTREQEQWGDAMRRLGAVYVVCRGGDIEAHVEAVRAAVEARACR